MYTQFSNEEIYNHARQGYSVTSIQKGGYKVFLNALRDFTVPIGETLSRVFNSKVLSESTNFKYRSISHALGNKISKEFGEEFSRDFNAVAAELRDLPTEESRTRARFLERKDALEFFHSIPNPIGKGVMCLAYDPGLAPYDLFLVSNLSGLKEGKVSVQSSYNRGAFRLVEFNPTTFNELDPDGQLVQWIEERKASGVGNYNIGFAANALSSFHEGCGSDIYSMRNSSAINLLNDGVDPEEIARIQGVTVATLDSRLKTFKEKLGLN